MVEMFVGSWRSVAGWFVLLEVVSPLQEVGVHLVLGDEGVLVPVSEEPAVFAALKTSMIGFHLTCLILHIPTRSISMLQHVRPRLIKAVVDSELLCGGVHVADV